MTPIKVDSFSRGDLLSRHLLVEAALLDSSKFDILAIDEVDALKKEKQAVDLRIESARRKLAMETKVRDAAQSLHRLYAAKPSTKSQRRQSIMPPDRRTSGSSTNSGTANQAEEELSASNKKMDDLLQILHGLENRRQYIESRLLRHTAAVLQAAHAEREAEMSQSLQDSGFGDRDYDESIFTNIDSLSELKLTSNKKTHQSNPQWSDVNLRLQMLNRQLQSLISQAKQDQTGHGDDSADDIPSAYPTDDQDAIDHLNTQLETMQTAITTLAQEYKDSNHALEVRIETANSQLYTIISTESGQQNMYDVRAPPPITGHGTAKQMDYLDETLLTIEQTIQHAAHVQEDFAKYESTITGLWDMLSSEKTPNAQEGSGLASPLAKEPYSLQAFNTRVQHMFERLTNMDLQIDTLRRQIQQQRDLAGKAEADQEENQAHKRRVEELNSLLDDHKRRVEELTSLLGNANTAKETAESRLNSLLGEANTAKDAAEARLNSLLGEANTAKNAAEARLSDKTAEMAALESEIVRLSTELTMAKADLDGAYGSRGDRAKDVANNPAIQAQLSRLEQLEQESNRTRELEKELRDMTADYQELTRETVEVEKEREQIEAVVDSMRMRIEGLEGQLSDEKVKWLGVQTSGTPEAGATREQTSTMVMRAEFKKMMRETRAETLKALRVSRCVVSHNP